MPNPTTDRPLALLDTGAIFDPTINLAVDVVSSYVSHNAVSVRDLPALIRDTYATIEGLGRPQRAEPVADAVEKPTPAQIRKSMTDDALISFLDGKPYKTLKRHLRNHGLDPQSYRQRYGLPADYPMVSPSYSAERSALAKSIGLGVPGGRAPAPTGSVDTSIAA